MPLLARVRRVVRDPLYRGSLVLLINTALMAILGFVFWTLAARMYPAATVGTFSGLTLGITLVSTVAMLGLPNTITRHLDSAPNPRGLIGVSLAAITVLGSAASLLVILGIGPFLPSALHLQQHGTFAVLFTGLVIVAAFNTAISVALVVYRATHTLLWTNLVGAVTKLSVLVAFSSLRSSGLILAYAVSALVSMILMVPSLLKRLPRRKGRRSATSLMLTYLRGTLHNYLATIMGILPSTVMPLEVVAERGAAQAAPFVAAFLVAGFLNVIPSTTSQVLFAEASRQGSDARRQILKAIRATYALIIPALVVVIAAAPYIMDAFGTTYSRQASTALRILSLSALFTGGTYLVDSVLLARDRSGAYLFMNGANAVLVLGCAAVLLHRGLTGGAEGWALAQGFSLILGLVVVATGKVATTSAPDAEDVNDPSAQRISPSQTTSMELMLGPLAGAQESLADATGGFARLSDAARPRQRLSRPGEAAFCGTWYPAVEVAVGHTQVRTSRQLPVLVVVSAYSGWIAAELIPSRRSADLFAGCWRAFQQLGGKPQILVLETIAMATEFQWFCQSVEIVATQATRRERDLLQGVYVYLDQSFRTELPLHSPVQFGAQLADFLAEDNMVRGDEQDAAPASLVGVDREAMLPLAAEPPETRWLIRARVGASPYVRFDTNDYSVPPYAMGREVEIIADLHGVWVVCEGRLIAAHPRSWARATVVTDPAHQCAPRNLY